jgi:hypothetical protein
MIKKEYMTPELEQIDLVLESAVLTLSTSEEEIGANEGIDL